MRFFIIAALLVGCTVKDPLFCRTDADCDEERPYCDLAGTTSAAEGHANTCVPYPWDAGVPELCDGEDNDGDDLTDEDWPDLDQPCTVGMGACEATGTWVCTAAQDAVECSVTPGEPATQETCNDGIDDDCDGTADDGCPETPVARFPWNGYMTGSMRAAETSAGVKPTRPKFMWDPAANAETYELQIDDSCTTPGFATCTFPTPEAEETTTFTTHQLADDLPVSMTAPVGRRYYWRVRACNALACSTWSPTRYVDVGRLANDFNGDGYSDLLVGAPFDNLGATSGEGMVHLYLGAAGGIPLAPTSSFDLGTPGTGCRTGLAVASVGDLNADGFADAAIGSPFCDMGTTDADTGSITVFYGDTTPFGALDDDTFQAVSPQAGERFGAAIAGGGDLDGDGFHDLVVGAPRHDDGATNEGGVFIYFGEAGGVFAPDVAIDNPSNLANAEFGGSLSIGGDLDGDGLADLVVGAPFYSDDAVDEGHVFVFRGRADRTMTAADRIVDNPEDTGGAMMGFRSRSSVT